MHLHLDSASMSSSHSVGLGIHTRVSRDQPDNPSTHTDSSNISTFGADGRVSQPRRTLTGPRAPRQARLSQRKPHDQPMPPSATLDSEGLRQPQHTEDDFRTSEYCDRNVRPDASRNAVSADGQADFSAEPAPDGTSTVHVMPRLQRRASAGDYHSVVDRSRGSVFPRDVTLLSFGGSHARGAAELKSLLGNSNARLKAGAAILPEHARNSPDKKTRKELAVALEQAKSRARVEVDIVLESSVCVQGGYLRGHIKVRVRKRSKKESPVLLSEGKIRIVGYESVPAEDEHHTFYQCAAPLTAVTDVSSHSLYEAAADEEGFAPAVEGQHVLPFALNLPIDNSFGSPKGVFNVGSGISVRYIAMVSIKVKNADTGKQSIAHFYRHCEVWPYLDPATILQSASRPLQASTAKSMALIGNSAKVKLHAQMHRLYWPAGARCPVAFHVVNNSKKTIRTVVLTLVRTMTVFRPRPELDAAGDRDPDACQTATTHKVVAESTLEMCAGVAKGHASAKGWWTGVAPGRELDFVHYIPLPADALSVTRARLLEVEYSIRVTISAGSLSPDVSVTLPIRIFNFISTDPPPTAGLLSSSGAYIRPSYSLLSQNTDGPPMSMTEIAAQASNNKLLSVSPEEEEMDPLPLPPYPSRTCSLRVTNPDADLPPPPSRPPLAPADSETSFYSTSSSASDMDDGYALDAMDMSTAARSTRSRSKTLGNLDLGEHAGSDDEVEAVLSSVKLDTGHFADRPRPDAPQARRPQPRDKLTDSDTDVDTDIGTAARRARAQACLRASRSQPGMARAAARPDADADVFTPRVEGVGAFAARVQEKRRAMAVARLQERVRAGTVSGMGPGHGRASVSMFLPGNCAEDADRTPRLGYSSMRECRRPVLEGSVGSVGSTSSETGSDVEEQLLAAARKNSRRLPRPPVSLSLHRSGENMAGLHESSSSSQSSAGVPASTSRILPTPPSSVSPRKTASEPIPPVPPIPAHLRALCAKQAKRDSDPLRQAIIRPPRSPLRPLARGSSDTPSSDDSGSGVRGRIAALEEQVRHSMDGSYAQYY